MNQTNLNPAVTTTIIEPALIERFNSELAARGDARQLHADRSTRLGDFRLQAKAGERLWLKASELEWMARRNGILLNGEVVQFNHVPLTGRAYASPT
jgi:hypothetical protein